MPALFTALSTKGQVVLPKALRDRRNWTPGTRLVVEETPRGILLREASPRLPATTVDEVFGSAGYTGPALSVEEMDAALDAAGRRLREGD